jgi:hypothetical protein
MNPVFPGSTVISCGAAVGLDHLGVGGHEAADLVAEHDEALMLAPGSKPGRVDQLHRQPDARSQNVTGDRSSICESYGRRATWAIWTTSRSSSIVARIGSYVWCSRRCIGPSNGQSQVV